MSPSREIRCRRALALPLVRQLRRPVFGCAAVFLATRSMLFSSYVLSRFMHGFSTWHFRTLQDAQLWTSNLLKLYQSLVPAGLKGPGFHTLDLLISSGQLCSPLLASKHRLALFRRFLSLDSPSLLGILMDSLDIVVGWTWYPLICACFVTLCQKPRCGLLWTLPMRLLFVLPFVSNHVR